MVNQVFINYEAADREAAEKLAVKLREAGFELWFDAWHLPTGAAWQPAIEEALKNSQACLIVIGPTQVRGWVNSVMQEIAKCKSLDSAFKVIPVLLPRADLTLDYEQSLPEFVAQFAAVDFGTSLDDETAFLRLINAIRGELPDSTRRIRIPDIAWIEIPAGSFIYGEGSAQTTRHLDTFWIGKFPVTNAQYQTFIDDDGYDDDRWWHGPEKPKPESSNWPQSNRPRTNVDWYEAVAFTRWLAVRLGLEIAAIRLPTEIEWE